MTCPWNNNANPWFPVGTCPILWHTLYPYFLGFVFNAKFSPEGPANVCCPAEKGIDLVVSVKPWDSGCPPWVPSDWRDVIQAEVVAVNGWCPYKHKIGDRIFFPTCAKHSFVCPAITNTGITLLMSLFLPKCINRKRLRCPDWKEQVYFSLEG